MLNPKAVLYITVTYNFYNNPANSTWISTDIKKELYSSVLIPYILFSKVLIL